MIEIENLVNEVIINNFFDGNNDRAHQIEGSLKEMGLDSLDIMELAIDLEGDLIDNGYRFSSEFTINEDMTVSDICNAIKERAMV